MAIDFLSGSMPVPCSAAIDMLLFNPYDDPPPAVTCSMLYGLDAGWSVRLDVTDSGSGSLVTTLSLSQFGTLISSVSGTYAGPSVRPVLAIEAASVAALGLSLDAPPGVTWTSAGPFGLEAVTLNDQMVGFSDLAITPG